MRREPQLGRGKKTHQLILDTTALMLESQRFETITTNAIAAKAGISIGTLYQYFPDKELIFLQLTQQANEHFTQFFRQAFSNQDKPLKQLIAEVLQQGLALNEAIPGLKRLMMNQDLSPLAAEQAQKEGRVVVGILADYLARKSQGKLDQNRASLCALVTIQLFKSLLMARSEHPELKDVFLNEYQRLIQAYWEEILPQPPADKVVISASS